MKVKKAISQSYIKPSFFMKMYQQINFSFSSWQKMKGNSSARH